MCINTISSCGKGHEIIIKKTKKVTLREKHAPFKCVLCSLNGHSHPLAEVSLLGDVVLVR